MNGSEKGETILLAKSTDRLDSAALIYQQERMAHWDDVAKRTQGFALGIAYHRRLAEIYRFQTSPGQRIVELGCGQGDLLAELQPAVGVGIDFSAEMLRKANNRHPDLNFIQTDVHHIPLNEPFDIIILSDLLNDLWDVQTVFEEIHKISTSSTRVIINVYSRLWQLPLSIVRKLGLARPNLSQNWLTIEDVANLLSLAGFEIIRSWQEVLFPVAVPVLERVFNRFLVKIWPFRYCALTNFMVARLALRQDFKSSAPSVSVIIPARNEAGNISEVFRQTPRMGNFTELIFVEGHSEDDTYETIEESIREHPEWNCKFIRQTGHGKGDAVRLGFGQAEGDILMIFDADLTMPAENLSRFYTALTSGLGDFINGVRLVYPMENDAMRFFNLLGNKFFGLAFSWLLGQPIKDSLCGTKVLWKSDYEAIAANRSYFGDFDPFGDFDLLFGAAKLNLKIVDLPVRYRKRSYGITNIQRWKHGIALLKMVLFAAFRIKFV